MTAYTLKTVVFFGSAKTITPPWGGDARLGDRVLSWVKNTLSNRSSTLGGDSIVHSFIVLDPIEVFGPDGALADGGALKTPLFYMAPKDMSPKALALVEAIRDADNYLIVSPEYNHTVPPALASLMGHFGGSLYTCKPSGIITYSAGPYGGARAALGIATMCHELGCLPVSKFCHIPTAQMLLEENGKPKGETPHRMLNQLGGLLDQVEWMAVAMKNQRDKVGVF